MAMYVFLRRNGLEFTAPEVEVVEVFLALAAGNMPEEELAARIRRYAQHSAKK